MQDLLTVLGDRQAAIVREITKKFEQSVRGVFSELLENYWQNGFPKGEIVIVVSPAEQKKMSPDEIETMIRQALNTMSVKEAAAMISQKTGEAKKTIYQRALEIKNGAQ